MAEDIWQSGDLYCHGQSIQLSICPLLWGLADRCVSLCVKCGRVALGGRGDITVLRAIVINLDLQPPLIKHVQHSELLLLHKPKQ